MNFNLDDLQKDFLDEIGFMIEQCEESYLKLEDPTVRREELDQIFRLAHSLKGTGAAVGLNEIASFAHVVEDLLSFLKVYPKAITSEVITLLLKAGDAIKSRVTELKSGSGSEWDTEALRAELSRMTQELTAKWTEMTPESLGPMLEQTTQKSIEAVSDVPSVPDRAQTELRPVTIVAKPPEDQHEAAKVISNVIKINSDRLDSVMDLVGELVVLKGQLLQDNALVEKVGSRVESILRMLDKSVRDLHSLTLGLRMVPVKQTFLKLQRLSRDLSLKLEKSVELTLKGEEVEIDRGMLDVLNDPLVHIVRNAIDHGIETAAERTASGKPEKATLSITASQGSSHIQIIVKDDGRGMRPEKIVEKAIEKGVLDPEKAKSLSRKEILNLIFLPGFSTAATVSDVSGRGVGLDVVKSNIEKMRGKIDFETEPGKGTTFKFNLPLNTSITDGMVVTIQEKKFILPMYDIIELLQADQVSTRIVSENSSVADVNGKLFPIYPVERLLHIAKPLWEHSPEQSEVLLESDDSLLQKKIVLLLQHENRRFAFPVDSVNGQSQVVVKSFKRSIPTPPAIGGAAVLGDGRVALYIDVEGLIKEGYG